MCFKLVCANRPAAATATTFKNNSYKKSYEFVIVFSSVGIMLFYMNHPYINTMYCINQIPDISKFIHTAAGTYNFEAILEQRPAEFLMPNNWILSKHIPVNRKLTFEYFPGFERTRIEVRLLDSEGKMAIDILIMILKNIIYIRRRAIDPWYFAPCNNKYFTGPKLGKLEISIFSNRFTIGLRVNTEDNKMDMLECTIYGNLVNSDGIQEAIFSSTNPYTIVYAQYIYSMNLY
ncbi:30S ribosomal protein [Dirofilaria immitis]